MTEWENSSDEERVRVSFNRINQRKGGLYDESDLKEMRQNLVNKYGKDVVEKVEKSGTRITKAEDHVAHESWERKQEPHDQVKTSSGGVWSRVRRIVAPTMEERKSDWERRQAIRGIQIKKERQELELDRVRLHRAKLQNARERIRTQSQRERGPDPLSSMFGGGGEGGGSGGQGREREHFDDPMAAMFRGKKKREPPGMF